ncbi:DNA translocase FtsK 4TM domain-containing protein [Halomonas kenyensis]|uniref:DNA translocase FtsK n=1 Tax=Billgrantia kenyensis TaxID=321266 RepID=A0A7V9W1S2_9GAMM|nr:DNA translocase FtsK 4TM domain-containing protein [Halomonas kenyensis]MCG6662685.1 DNA translocase FtsK [Halomonas kenyensis]
MAAEFILLHACQEGTAVCGARGLGILSAKEKGVPRRATEESPQQPNRRLAIHLHGVAREGAIIVLLAACVFLLLALFSYQPSDPGWSQRGPETDVANWMGPFGAWLADVLYSLFGASALWWPGMLGFAGWWLIRSRKVQIEWDATAVAVRLGGLVLLLLGTTTLGALHFYSPDSALPYASGGILGEGLVGALVPLVDSGGTGLLAVAAMLCGFPLFSGVSWFTVMDETGHGFLRLWRWAATPFGLMRERSEPHWDDDELAEPQAPEAESAATSVETTRPRWRFWQRRGTQPAPDTGEQREPGLEPTFGDDGDTDIPWDIPERTPSAKRPEAAYTAQRGDTSPSPGTGSAPTSSLPQAQPGATRAAEPFAAAAALKASRHDEPVAAASMPLRATDALEAEREDGEPDSVTDGPQEAKAAADLQPAEPQAPEGDAATVTGQTSPRREPELGELQPQEPADIQEPRLNWDDIGGDSYEDEFERAEEERAIQPRDPHHEPAQAAPEAPLSAADPEERPAAYGDQAEGLRSWRESTARDQAASAEGQAPQVATAEQARAAAEEPEGPTLWTVEHLQSQRPVLEDMPEPDGELPSLRLLTPAEPHQRNYTDQQLADMAELLETRLREYGVKAEVVHTWPGPVITRFEIKPAAGVKVSKISNLAKDLARSLMVKSVRVVEVIPGRPTVGIEIPNPHRAMIRLREVIDSDRYQQEASALTLALGQDIGGGPVVANLGKMPHLLVAGTTGSGKSVGVNAMLISMLLKATPEELRLIMVDPKMLELSVYDGIPHLLAPVVTDMKEAANGLRWCVAEMERRYKLMAAMGVRNIAGFNGKLDEAEQAGAQVADPLWEPQPWEMHEPPPVLEKLPYIVVVIDEFADMFMIVGKKVEELIARLAQKARAAGIHLILATQRPSVDVVTGLIKANIPTRMAFQVSSKVDSRTILDQGGAENLLGHGDMLYLPAGAGLPTRVHGAFVDDDEVHRVVEDWKRRGEPEYIDEILSGGVSADALTGLEADAGEGGGDAEQDALYDEAVQFVTESRRASISAVQRRFKIGYNRAARLVEAMEAAGVVSSMGSNGGREVLAPPPVGN